MSYVLYKGIITRFKVNLKADKNHIVEHCYEMFEKEIEKLSQKFKESKCYIKYLQRKDLRDTTSKLGEESELDDLDYLIPDKIIPMILHKTTIDDWKMRQEVNKGKDKESWGILEQRNQTLEIQVRN